MSNIHNILCDPRFIDAGIAERVRFDSGESVISEGSQERAVYVIESGWKTDGTSNRASVI